eukprot:928601-Rhodomonas_salina.1
MPPQYKTPRSNSHLAVPLHSMRAYTRASASSCARRTPHRTRHSPAPLTRWPASMRGEHRKDRECRG